MESKGRVLFGVMQNGTILTPALGQARTFSRAVGYAKCSSQTQLLLIRWYGSVRDYFLLEGQPRRAYSSLATVAITWVKREALLTADHESVWALSVKQCHDSEQLQGDLTSRDSVLAFITHILGDPR